MGAREMRREREREKEGEVEEARAANAARRRREFLASENAKRNREEQQTPLARIRGTIDRRAKRDMHSIVLR